MIKVTKFKKSKTLLGKHKLQIFLKYCSTNFPMPIVWIIFIVKAEVLAGF